MKNATSTQINFNAALHKLEDLSVGVDDILRVNPKPQINDKKEMETFIECRNNILRFNVSPDAKSINCIRLNDLENVNLKIEFSQGSAILFNQKHIQKPSDLESILISL
ncbi:hypothetical protein [Vibrio splendidus]|uniref:Uncharacterized protein n=1 Tax=Vibrio splendidus TaxID=29497 RepID=A0A2N7JZE8_VIBSP|nr:hypothetical protein [Vibrio splendidus]PMM66000.1 hypothetical protein BCT54_16290 [Vibrio splendidus]